MVHGFDPISFLDLPAAQIVVWAIATIGAAILFAKTRSWPTILIFLGSACYLVSCANLVFIELAVHRHWVSPLLLKNLTLINVTNDGFTVATVLISVGLLFHGLRTTRHI
jgi:hypothetical protein